MSRRPYAIKGMAVRPNHEEETHPQTTKWLQLRNLARSRMSSASEAGPLVWYPAGHRMGAVAPAAERVSAEA
jgi:hypothetical protein